MHGMLGFLLFAGVLLSLQGVLLEGQAVQGMIGEGHALLAAVTMPVLPIKAVQPLSSPWPGVQSIDSGIPQMVQQGQGVGKGKGVTLFLAGQD